jgi:transcriptional regulator with PAS, ATPase and Fis domain
MEGLIKKSKFRKDLFYRLNSFQVQLIPLRERKEDIYLLTNKFLQQYCMENGMNILEVPEQIHHVLKHHHWEGNVRELRNVIQRAVLLAKQHQSGRVLPNYLPDYLTNKLEPLAMEEETGGLDQAINQYEIRLIQDALNRYNNNKKKAAEFLKIPRATLYYKMEKHNISV